MILESKKACTSLLLVVLLAGCIGGYPGLTEKTDWTLSVTGYEKSQEESYIFDGEVRLGGSTTAPKAIRNVRVKFLTGNNETIRTVHIGTLNSSRWQSSINVTLDQRPKYVLLLVGEVVTSENKPRKFNIYGLQRDENGDYYRYTSYDPTPSDE